MINGMRLRWHEMPTIGGGQAAVLLQGEIVRGWVCTATGLVWCSYLPPLGSRPEEQVNVFTDGRLLCVQPTAERAMQAVTARCIADARRKSQPTNKI